ncbi:hypothetical protein RRG08_034468 [Elysia crispata]|uniref:Uncharacterized protein n=1 Tax=Elysia crispata TaxID=231223 RepID=A0AAE0XS90_9GAST|nr:hypothetical protein RRG08_034468 [Elysia crispata]
MDHLLQVSKHPQNVLRRMRKDFNLNEFADYLNVVSANYRTIKSHLEIKRIYAVFWNKQFKMETEAITSTFSPSTSLILITFIFTALLCWYVYKAAHVTKMICINGMEIRSRRLGLTMFSTGLVILILLLFIINDQKRLLSEKWAFRTDSHGEGAGLFLLYLTPLACGIGNVVLLADSFIQWRAQTFYYDYSGQWTRGVTNIVMCVMPWIIVRLFSVECLCDCHRRRFRTYSAACAMAPVCFALLVTGVYMCTVKKRVLIRNHISS